MDIIIIFDIVSLIT